MVVRAYSTSEYLTKALPNVMIDAVEFRVLESLQSMPLGYAQFSKVYDLDISRLEEYLSSVECQTAQFLKPGEADRFGVVISAPTFGASGSWRCSTLFKTNYGPTRGPEVEIWLPRPTTVSSFGEVKEHITSQAEKAINAKQPIVVESTLGRSAGYRTLIVMGISILSYYGPQPLMKAPGTLSLAQLMSEGSREENAPGGGPDAV